MKKYFNLSCIYSLIIVISTSCSDEIESPLIESNTSVGTETPVKNSLNLKSSSFSSNKIYYFNDDTQVDVEITETEYQNFLINETGIPSNATFIQSTIEYISDETGSGYLIVTTATNNGFTYSLTHLLDELSNNEFRLTGETCECKSSGCLAGCIKKKYWCACTSCGIETGTCTKKHTITNDIYSSMFL